MARKASSIVQSFSIPGLKPSEGGGQYSIDFSDIQASSNVFVATGFRLKRRERDLLILLGSNSEFDESPTAFDVAIELVMPLHAARKSLVDGVFTLPSARGPEPVLKTVERSLSPDELDWASKYSCTLGPPVRDRANVFRQFPVTAASVIWSDNRGYLEFVEIPGTALLALHTRQARRGDGVRSVLTVVMEAKLFYSFFVRIRELCGGSSEINISGGQA